jgi:hypothetical protein
MGIANPSVKSNGLTDIRRPLGGRLESSEITKSKIIGQWNGDPQSVFIFPK